MCELPVWQIQIAPVQGLDFQVPQPHFLQVALLLRQPLPNLYLRLFSPYSSPWIYGEMERPCSAEVRLSLEIVPESIEIS